MPLLHFLGILFFFSSGGTIIIFKSNPFTDGTACLSLLIEHIQRQPGNPQQGRPQVNKWPKPIPNFDSQAAPHRFSFSLDRHNHFGALLLLLLLDRIHSIHLFRLIKR